MFRYINLCLLWLIVSSCVMVDVSELLRTTVHDSSSQTTVHGNPNQDVSLLPEVGIVSVAMRSLGISEPTTPAERAACKFLLDQIRSITDYAELWSWCGLGHNFGFVSDVYLHLGQDATPIVLDVLLKRLAIEVTAKQLDEAVKMYPNTAVFKRMVKLLGFKPTPCTDDRDIIHYCSAKSDKKLLAKVEMIGTSVFVVIAAQQPQQPTSPPSMDFPSPPTSMEDIRRRIRERRRREFEELQRLEKEQLEKEQQQKEGK